MKIVNYWIVAIMALSFSLAFTSCDEDDNKITDDEAGNNLAEIIAGTYDGYTKAVAQYFPNGQYAGEQSVKLTANENGTANVSYTSSSFGTFTIENVQVTLANGAYNISGSGKTVMGMTEESKSEYDCTITGSIDASSKAPSFVFDVPSVMGGLKITFIPGNIPAGLIVAGTYDGYTKAIAQYFPNGQYAGEQSVKLTENEDGTVNVSYTSSSFGTFTIENAQVTLSNGAYSISGSGKTVMGMTEESKNEYDCTITGSIDASTKTPSFVFDVPSVMGGLKITFIPGDIPGALVVAGTYKGFTKAVSKYFPDGMFDDNQTIIVTANEDQTVTITHTSSTFGTFTIEKATVTFADNVYTITGDGKTVMGMDESSQKEYDCKLNATVDKDKETPSFVFTVPAVMGGTTITFSPGNAPTAE